MNSRLVPNTTRHEACSELAVLISIRPEQVAKIFAGEKTLEFRRRWACRPVTRLVIYSSWPRQEIIALADIAQTHRGSPADLWALAQTKKGGIEQHMLYAYLDGCATGYALELTNVRAIPRGIQPRALFGASFRPPQSFRYLKARALQRIEDVLRAQQEEED